MPARPGAVSGGGECSSWPRPGRRPSSLRRSSPPYYLITLCYALVLSIACLGLNLLFGTTGLLSLGHAAYFGVGAYTGGFLYAFTPLASLELYLASGVLSALALAAAFAVAFLASTALLWRVSRSPFGKALRAIRDNQTSAACIGLPVRQFRWYAFILSGTFAGLAGSPGLLRAWLRRAGERRTAG